MRLWLRNAVEEITLNLSVIQKRNLRKLLGAGLTISSGDMLVYFVADLLVSVKLCNTEQQRLIIEEYYKQIKNYGDALEGYIDGVNDEDLPVCLLGFCDRQYCTTKGSTRFLDLTSGETKSGIQTAFLEIINYNLTTLYTRRRKLVLEKSSNESKSNTDSDNQFKSEAKVQECLGR